MARLEDVAFAPAEWTQVASGTAATATATRAGVAGKYHFITGVTYSASAAPTGAVTVQVRDNGTAADKFEVPASAFAAVVVNYVRPIRISQGSAADITMPSLGGGVTGTVSIRGFTR